MKLELKHISPYLPYGLKLLVERIHHEFICHLVVSNNSNSLRNGLNANMLIEYNAKPILRPLSELNVESIESTLFGKMSDNIAEWFKYFDSDSQNKDIAILQAPYPVLEYCFENHFDVFSLIKNGLAIDINTL